MVRENGDTAMDGADEKMLDSDEKAQLAVKNNIEVKFISGDQNGTNGDAKIDVGAVEKVRNKTKSGGFEVPVGFGSRVYPIN